MKLLLISLGCDKNLVDSEMMITSLRRDGFEIVDDEETAEVIVVNTCCFIGDAKEESINTLLEMAEYKESGSCRLLVAAGCLAQRYHDEIKSEIPEVDVIVGTMGYEEMGTAIGRALQEGGVVESLKDINYLPEPRTDRENSTGGCYAYLKIAEGCDKCCSYCVIPQIRGHYRSIPMENLTAQAQHLADRGVKELILVAQETTLYGTDLYGEKKLPELLERLSDVGGFAGFGFYIVIRRRLHRSLSGQSSACRRCATIWIYLYSTGPILFCAAWDGAQTRHGLSK